MPSPRFGARSRRLRGVAALAVGAVVATTTLLGTSGSSARADQSVGSAPNLLNQLQPYVNPSSMAARQSKILTGDNARAAVRIASVPQARWVAPSDGMPGIKAYLDGAADAGRLPQIVIYGLPERDCGNYSAGGSYTSADYATWVTAVRGVIDHRPTVVILEPDGLSSGGCQSGTSALALRLADIAAAVDVLSLDPTTGVYIDAGHEQWLTPSDAAQRLQLAHVSRARGFSLNVSNMYPSPNEVAYGQQISALIGGKPFVIDTSRNGAGPAAAAALNWCNPSGRLAGQLPHGVTGTLGLDGFLWVKAPGESDGPCRSGEPSSGQWFAAWATDFTKRSVVAAGGTF